MDNNKISAPMDFEEQFTIPPQVYEQQHHFYFEKAAETALFEGEVMPMVVLNKGPDLYFFPMLFENEAEKEKSLVMVKCIAHKLKSTHAYTEPRGQHGFANLQ